MQWKYPIYFLVAFCWSGAHSIDGINIDNGIEFQDKCIVEDNGIDSYKNIGENWQSATKCIIYECELVGGRPQVSSFEKSCANVENCPPEDIYTEDCCEYCRKPGRFPKDPKINDEEDDFMNVETYLNHPCIRDCIENEEPMTCNYTFMVEWYQTLSKACYDCPTVEDDCFRPHCVVGDGARRNVLVVNRMMPGPSIQVCAGDTIVVDLKNELLDEGTTIHWHGLHMRDNPYMDGVPFISQCAIPPKQSFTYEFLADNPGTHFWHSHIGMQRGDGAFGSLIIRVPRTVDRNADLYDFDLPSKHVMLVQDWTHIPGVAMFAAVFHSVGDNKPPTILINGMGKCFETPPPPPPPSADIADNNLEFFRNHEKVMPLYIDESVNIPHNIFEVAKGSRYRFRLINAEFMTCPVELSVDGHNITVIASDGYDLEAIEVESFVSYAGERFDFVINADKDVGNYWIRVKGFMDCGPRNKRAFTVAILRYAGADENDPPGELSYDFVRTGLQLNALNVASGLKDTRTIPELKSIHPDDVRIKEVPDFKYYVYYDFNRKDNPHFHKPGLYGYNDVKSHHGQATTPQLNHISMKMPAVPLMPQRDLVQDNMFCNSSSLSVDGIDCEQEFCECSHVVQIPLGALVELVLVDEGASFDANHPFHLHGYGFRVVGMDRLGSSITINDLKRMDDAGELMRNLENAPIKDTVTIPDGGYTIIRFVADNPGYWLFHCHIEFHAEIGMALVLKVGEHSDMKPIPKNFPTCGNYVPSGFVDPNDSSRLYSSWLIILLTLLTLAITK